MEWCLLIDGNRSTSSLCFKEGIPVSAPDIALCTYTYNDGPFVHGLLDSISDWTVKPDHILIIDDGSDSPYSPPSTDIPASVVRISPNRGIKEAKQTGLENLSATLLFSVDADVRLSPTYLETCLTNLRHPGVGLVSGASVYRSGHDLVSRYLQVFGDNHNRTANGPVDFIPGNAFLLSRSTWEKVGGFGDHKESVCEDHALCQQMRKHGFTLWADSSIQAWQTRRISRHAHCMRIWKWVHRAVKNYLLQAQNEEAVVHTLQEALLKPMIDRIGIALDLKEHLFIYMEMLYLVVTHLDSLGFLLENNKIGQSLSEEFQLSVHTRLARHPHLYSLLLNDIQSSNQNIKISEKSCQEKSSWSEYFGLWDSLEQTGFLKWLNEKGCSEILVDEKQTEYAFSSYAQSVYT